MEARKTIKKQLVILGILFSIYFIIYVIGGSDKWFSRLSMAIGCFSVYAIIDAIESIKIK
jgi:hypothetical protein